MRGQKVKKLLIKRSFLSLQKAIDVKDATHVKSQGNFTWILCPISSSFCFSVIQHTYPKLLNKKCILNPVTFWIIYSPRNKNCKKYRELEFYHNNNRILLSMKRTATACNTRKN